MESEVNEQQSGRISDMGLLDLRFAKTADDLAHIKSISDVGAVLISENLIGALAGIDMHDVGGIVPVPQDCKVNCMTGQIQLSADSLAAGDPDTVLLIAGQAFISGDIESVGYKEVRVFGQLFAPRAGQAVLSAKLAQMSGQVLYIASEPRILMGEETIGGEFLELLPSPVSLVIMGRLTFEPTATRDIVHAKVLEIVLLGSIHAPRELVPLIQVLTKTKMGEIVASS